MVNQEQIQQMHKTKNSTPVGKEKTPALTKKQKKRILFRVSGSRSQYAARAKRRTEDQMKSRWVVVVGLVVLIAIVGSFTQPHAQANKAAQKAKTAAWMDGKAVVRPCAAATKEQVEGKRLFNQIHWADRYSFVQKHIADFPVRTDEQKAAISELTNLIRPSYYRYKATNETLAPIVAWMDQNKGLFTEDEWTGLVRLPFEKLASDKPTLRTVKQDSRDIQGCTCYIDYPEGGGAGGYSWYYGCYCAAGLFENPCRPVYWGCAEWGIWSCNGNCYY